MSLLLTCTYIYTVQRNSFNLWGQRTVTVEGTVNSGSSMTAKAQIKQTQSPHLNPIKQGCIAHNITNKVPQDSSPHPPNT